MDFRPIPKPARRRNKKDRGNPQKARQEVIEFDGELCRLCNKMHNLQLHRIIYGSQGGKYESSNTVLLCIKCHEMVHSNKNKWLPILQKFVSERVIK